MKHTLFLLTINEGPDLIRGHYECRRNMSLFLYLQKVIRLNQSLRSRQQRIDYKTRYPEWRDLESKK